MSTISNVAKFAVAVVASLATAELGLIGAQALEADAKVTYKTLNPTPIKVKKKGLFKKTEVVTVNPITGKMKPYSGKKEPANKKPYKY